MRNLPAVLAFGAVLLIAGCGPFQTYGQAMQTACDAPVDCTACTSGDPAQRALLLSRYIADHTWNRDAKDVFVGLAHVAPEDKGRLLREAASKAGVVSCPMADLCDAAQAEQPPAR